jgi:hypothetical protein
MEPNKTAIERAFDLAQTGLYSDVGDVKARLRDEGYFTYTVTGPMLRAQLKRVMEAAQKSRWSSRASNAGTVAVAKAERAKSRRVGLSTALRSSSKMGS